MRIIETERLVLRHFVMADLDDIIALVYADPQVKETWSGINGTPEELKARFEQRYVHNTGLFNLHGLELKETHLLIGLMGFQRHSPSQGNEIHYLLTLSAPDRRVGFDPDFIEVELTYALGRPYWKQGYATEMGRALIAYGFEKLGIGRMIQGVLTSNPNSVHLMERLGFRIETGLNPDETVGIMERADWEKSRSGAD